jgi:hypothetical protein
LGEAIVTIFICPLPASARRIVALDQTPVIEWYVHAKCEPFVVGIEDDARAQFQEKRILQGSASFSVTGLIGVQRTLASLYGNEIRMGSRARRECFGSRTDRGPLDNLGARRRVRRLSRLQATPELLRAHVAAVASRRSRRMRLNPLDAQFGFVNRKKLPTAMTCISLANRC